MQTAGGFALAVFAPAAVLALVSDTAAKYVLRILHGIGLLILSVGFIGRFPYYRQFHSGYNQLLFNTANDDVWALFLSLVYEYNLPLRFAAACLLAYVLWRLSNAFIEWEMPLQSLSGTALWVCRGVTVVGIGFLVQLSVFGGSLGWQTAVDWENAGVTRDPLLNEAVLDDAQAVYRGYTMNHRLLACNGLDFTTDEVRRLAAKLANRPADTDDLDVYLTRTAKGGKIEKPKHIFVIIGESFANWPLLSKYKELHIADGTREIINGPDSESVISVNGVVICFNENYV
jgi:phosphoglycerol transferase MdoB-like AlkP superfamily enzyme